MKLIVDILGKFKKKTYPIAWYVFPAIFKTFIGPNLYEHVSDCCVSPDAKYISVTTRRILAEICS